MKPAPWRVRLRSKSPLSCCLVGSWKAIALPSIVPRPMIATRSAPRAVTTPARSDSPLASRPSTG